MTSSSRSRGAAASICLLLASCGPAADAPKEMVVIPPGATLRQVAESLAAHQVIQSKTWFRIVARLGRNERRLRSGTYELQRGTGAIEAARTIAAGRTLLSRFTVPEGFTLLDIAEAAERTLEVPRADFLAAARDTVLLREFQVPAKSFEGFLWPETYLFGPNVTASTLVREMASTFRETWDPAWDATAAAHGLDRLGLVTLASIVEGEARADEDRPLIAAVLWNRMRRGMALQVDATIQYAIQLARGERKPRLYQKDYDFASPYNTYLHPGLPPGPVGAPSMKSLEAVIHPATVSYLYYVATPDGRHVFSRTYEEHLRAVRRVQRGR